MHIWASRVLRPKISERLSAIRSRRANADTSASVATPVSGKKAPLVIVTPPTSRDKGDNTITPPSPTSPPFGSARAVFDQGMLTTESKKMASRDPVHRTILRPHSRRRPSAKSPSGRSEPTYADRMTPQLALFGPAYASAAIDAIARGGELNNRRHDGKSSSPDNAKVLPHRSAGADISQAFGLDALGSAFGSLDLSGGSKKNDRNSTDHSSDGRFKTVDRDVRIENRGAGIPGYSGDDSNHICDTQTGARELDEAYNAAQLDRNVSDNDGTESDSGHDHDGVGSDDRNDGSADADDSQSTEDTYGHCNASAVERNNTSRCYLQNNDESFTSVSEFWDETYSCSSESDMDSLASGASSVSDEDGKPTEDYRSFLMDTHEVDARFLTPKDIVSFQGMALRNSDGAVLTKLTPFNAILEVLSTQQLFEACKELWLYAFSCRKKEPMSEAVYTDLKIGLQLHDPTPDSLNLPAADIPWTWLCCRALKLLRNHDKTEELRRICTNLLSMLKAPWCAEALVWTGFDEYGTLRQWRRLEKHAFMLMNRESQTTEDLPPRAWEESPAAYGSWEPPRYARMQDGREVI